MNNDVAVFLDLDNMVIGAEEVKLTFEINLVLGHIKSITDGRIVLRRAYGDWRQRANMTKELASAGFELQSTVRLSSNSKNLADMQLVVDAMGTVIDGHNFSTYVLITGDRDFAPLVHALRKRGKQVIGVGVRHASSYNLVRLCDHFIYYDEIALAAQEMLEDQLEELLQRAMAQLLQDERRVPASLLKQRMQSLTKGAFGHSPQGKRSFHKLLSEHPDLVRLQQEGTTLYVSRPGEESPSERTFSHSRRRLSDSEEDALLEQALDELLGDAGIARASLLKQRMQDLSDGAFDETLQGDKSFRRFLDRHGEQVKIDQEGSTMYVGRAGAQDTSKSPVNGERLSTADATVLLEAALDDLLVGQKRVRASLLKQHMQESSNGAFDESQQGYESFREFLDLYPALVRLQQKGTTLLVYRPEEEFEEPQLHLRYRSELKKRGLRVVPADVRLPILKDLVVLLAGGSQIKWQQIVNQMTAYYQDTSQVKVSKSYVNDILRVARRAKVIGVQNGGNLAAAPVFLRIDGERRFQDAVIRCDATYLKEIQHLDTPFDLEEAALALYDTTARARYLKVILNRFPENGQSAL